MRGWLDEGAFRFKGGYLKLMKKGGELRFFMLIGFKGVWMGLKGVIFKSTYYSKGGKGLAQFLNGLC
jgi:hypothetical protein